MIKRDVGFNLVLLVLVVAVFLSMFMQDVSRSRAYIACVDHHAPIECKNVAP